MSAKKTLRERAEEFCGRFITETTPIEFSSALESILTKVFQEGRSAGLEEAAKRCEESDAFIEGCGIKPPPLEKTLYCGEDFLAQEIRSLKRSRSTQGSEGERNG